MRSEVPLPNFGYKRSRVRKDHDVASRHIEIFVGWNWRVPIQMKREFGWSRTDCSRRLMKTRSSESPPL